MESRKQHSEDEKLGRTNNTIAKNIIEMGHAIDWKGACYLKKEKS